MDRIRQQQSVAIKRGLFLVRYATAEDHEHPPIVKVSSVAAQNQDVSFVLHPEHTDAVLWQPDSCLVVRALAPAELSVEVMPSQTGGSAAATVRIEPLSQGKDTLLSAKKSAGINERYDLSNFRILAHVTGIGDQLVKANEWIAGPVAPARIEGISIAWPDRPRDLEIRYAVKTANPQPRSNRAASLGSFVGSRGKAMPIIGLMLELAGPAATALQFFVEAIFLGSPTIRTSGRRIAVSGPTGREPLVGLRVALQHTATAGRPLVNAAATAGAKPAHSPAPDGMPAQVSLLPNEPRRQRDRIRVFRNRSDSSQSVTA